MEKINKDWALSQQYRSYECPYCSILVSPSKSMEALDFVYFRNKPAKKIYSYLYFCNNCGRPTFQDGFKNNELFPKKIFGQKIELPKKYKEIQEGFEELKKCISVNSFTAAVMIGRKLLTIITYNYPETSNEIKMKIKDSQIKFIDCVDELKRIHVLPSINHHLFNKVRELGNCANHQLEQRTEDDAKEIYKAIELIMKTFENAEDKKEILNKIK